MGFHRVGITPNALSVVSLVFAALAGGVFFVATRERPELMLVAGALVAANALLDALDGKLARLTKQETRRGDYLDHVIDRYADVFILGGLALSPVGNVYWGLGAVSGVLLTSYMGTQAQALGLGRDYGGLLGRADRLVLLMAMPFVAWYVFVSDIHLPWDASPMTLLLAWFALVGNVTAIQRFAKGWKELGAGK
ncbi:MAG TPA: CDP-alcohol phosphatidyltransferase family protein [Candidatus Thermoplasmatota archaeon]|nr:CDP-alcohol phosphatidyltransferase family protein [Candidatus Thermoplasmatota archaeon]